MNSFDRLLDFLFHRIWGLLILGITAVGGAMLMTGCLPLNIVSCLTDGLCTSFGCSSYDSEYGQNIGCFEVCSKEVDSCLLSACSSSVGGIEEDGDYGNIFTCLLGKGCATTCGSTQCYSPGCGGCVHTGYYYCNGHVTDGPRNGSSPSAWNNSSNVKSCLFFACAKVPKEIANVTLNYSDGMFFTSETIYDTTDQGTLLLLYPTRTGFEFHGYFDKPNGQGKQYTDGSGYLKSGIKIRRDVTLYAYITEIGIGESFTLRFDSSTSLDFTQATATGGSAAPNLPKAPEKEGYTFLGWFTERDGQGTRVATNSGWLDGYDVYHAYNFDMRSDVTLYAYYSPETYDLILHIGGQKYSREVDYGTRLTDAIDRLMTFNGYSLDDDRLYTDGTYKITGWKTSASADAPTVDLNNVYIKGDLEYYANYSKKVTVRFEDYYEDGISKTITKDWYSGTAVVMPGTSGDDIFGDDSRPGYEFVGWYDGNGNKISASTFIYQESDSTVFYAHWEKAEYELRVYTNKSNSNYFRYTYRMGETVNLTASVTPTTGYEFVGWSFVEGQTTEGFYTLPTERDDKPLYGDVRVYPCWKPKTYTYTLNPMNGKDRPRTGEIVYETQATLWAPTREGYTFLGWWCGDTQLTDSNGKLLQEFTFGWLGQWDEYKDDLEGRWKKNTYKVNFKMYVPGMSPSALEVLYHFDVEYGGTVSVPSPDPSRTGYDFLCWVLETDNVYQGNNYQNAEAFDFSTPINKDTTFITKFRVQTFQLVFTVDGTRYNVTAEWGKKITDYGKAYVPVATEMRRFSHWSRPDESTVNDTDTVTGAMMFTAKYEYSTAFRFVRDDGDIINVRYFVGDTVTFPVPAAKNGYIFSGWYDGDTKLPESGVITEGMTTLYRAKWNTITYTITFRSSDGSRTLGTLSYNVEGAVNFGNVTFTVPVPTGYSFVGWGDSPYDGQKKTGLPVGTYGNKTFYVQYEANTYKVTLNPGEGTISSSASDVTYDKPYTLPVPAREGYNFLGWYLGGTQMTEGDGKSKVNWTMTESVTLEARYALKEYTVKFVDKDHTSDILYSAVYKHFETVTRPASQYENKTGYTFVEWQNADGTPYVFGATVTGDITVYGKFNVNSYTVTIVISPTESYTETLTYGTNLYSLIVSKYESKAGAYATEGNRQYLYFTINGERVVSGTTLGATDTTVRAEYKEPITIYFYEKVGEPATKTFIRYRGDKVPFYTPTRDGYIFEYWCTNSSLYTKVTDEDITLEDGGIYTYYAKWTPSNNNITLVVDGQRYNLTFRTSEDELSFDTLTGYPASALERTGWDFLGWYDGENGTGTKYENISAGTAMAGKTLYANMQRHKYKITLDAGEGKIDGQSSIVLEWEYGIVPTLSYDEITKPSGKELIGWYYRTEAGTEFMLFDFTGVISGARVEFFETLAQDITLYAKFG